ncbi:MAG: nuclear transport factor 2 family protein [Chthoniobacterales bacterium]
MKTPLTVAVITLLFASATAFAAPDEATLKAKETAAWQAYKDKKADDFKKVVSANMMAIYPDGIQDMQKEVSGMQTSDIKSFTISDYKVTAAGADTAIATYTVKIEGKIGGNDAAGTYNAGSVWKQEGSDWKAIFHTNIMQQSAAK